MLSHDSSLQKARALVKKWQNLSYLINLGMAKAQCSHLGLIGVVCVLLAAEWSADCCV